MNEERITKLEEMLKELQNELNSLKSESKEPEKKKEDVFERVAAGKGYYVISLKDKVDIYLQFETDSPSSFNANCFSNNNYFKTNERAEEVKSKIELLLKLERLHDTFCPDYKPDWNDIYCECKYFVEFDTEKDSYDWNYSTAYNNGGVYFPSKDIALKVCDILNRELDEGKSYEDMDE